MKLKIDKLFLFSVFLLSIAGFFIFSSASLGLLARNGASFESVASKQAVSLIIGIIVFLVMSNINYKYLRKYAFYIFVFAFLLNLLLFIPGLTQNNAGAVRWIDLKFVTFQPSEFLKISFILYFAAWLSSVKDNVKTFKSGILPYAVITGLLSIFLIIQRDMDTLVVIAGTGLLMLFTAGAKYKHVITVGLIMLLLVGIYSLTRPYAKQRVLTFFNPSQDLQGTGYQARQSLIAIGSGEWVGRGFGQSVQKFEYLPEPIGDSIFAVFSEEFGLVGSIMLILFFIFFFLQSLRIATHTSDSFAMLTVLGISILIVVESFMNISSMLGLIPIFGMPLLFVSHGGTALIVTLGAVGIIANISKYKKS